MPFTNAVAASYGLLAMHAMDMYRTDTHSLVPSPASGLTAAGWNLIAYISGRDALFARGPLQVLPQTVCYGYLAQRGTEFVAVIRGTDGFVEWVEDGMFPPIPYKPQTVLPSTQGPVAVEQGFWSIYAGMTLISPQAAPLGSLGSGIVAAVGAGTVTVIGHSLGAALATYLTLDLARGGLAGRVNGCFFASPHTGDQAFVRLFDTTVPDYRLFNYLLDVVPRVPLGLGYEPLPRRTVIRPATAEANIRVDIGCNHHVVCYAAMLDYESTMQALTPVPAGEEGSARCILGPETGLPNIAKLLASGFAGIVPV